MKGIYSVVDDNRVIVKPMYHPPRLNAQCDLARSIQYAMPLNVLTEDRANLIITAQYTDIMVNLTWHL